jgi:DNA-binding GntR family transcriptional regulator
MREDRKSDQRSNQQCKRTRLGRPTERHAVTILLRTAVEQVYEQLRAAIVRNELRPGRPLLLNELADELGVSTMPIRSALSMLQTEGLVRRVPHHGAFVAPLEVEDLEVIQAVRFGIEGLAARTGAACVTSADVDEMAMLFDRCGEIAVTGPIDLYLDAQWGMHDICYRASAREQLVGLIHQYRRRAERYIRLAVGSRALELNVPMQERFLDACRERDAGQAEEAIHNLLRWTVETLGPVIAKTDPAFVPASLRVRGAR